MNGSPDPSIVDGRIGGHISVDHSAESRVPFANPAAGAIGTPGQRRAIVVESMDQLLSNRGFSVGRSQAMDGLVFSGMSLKV